MTLREILVINDSAVVDGGAAKVAIETALALQNAGESVRFFAGGAESDQRLGGGTVHLTGESPLRGGRRRPSLIVRGIWNWRARQQLLSVIAAGDARSTIAHVHSWGSVLSPSIFSALRKAGIPTVITAHDYLMSCPNSCRYIFPRQTSCDVAPASTSCISEDCDRDGWAVKYYKLARYWVQTRELKKLRPTVVYVSEFQSRVSRKFSEIEHQSVVVANPIDLTSAAVRRESAKKPGPVLCVARLEPEKGVEDFCEAMRRGGTSGVVIGEGSERIRLEEKYPEVSFVGWVSAAEIREYYRTALALVFPSLWFEAAPLVPIEAQAIGELPLVISDASAASEYIDAGMNGWTFKGGDVDDLVRKVADVVEASRLESMIPFIRERGAEFRERHSDKNYVSAILRVYESSKVLAGPH